VAKLLERNVTVDLDGTRVLEGVYLSPPDDDALGAVVAPPHPLMGGSMDHPVVNELSYACRSGGEAASLRFNWRGVGGSAGTPSGELADGDADYSAALRFIEESVAGPVIAAGYSFGAAMALRASARHPRIRRLLLVAPPEQMLTADLVENFGGSILIVAAQNDQFANPAKLEALLANARRGTLHVVPDADHFFQEGLADIARAVAAWL
jgi:alpha/beta superfamily hydrolase